MELLKQIELNKAAHAKEAAGAFAAPPARPPEPRATSQRTDSPASLPAPPASNAANGSAPLTQPK
jgi:hypothetical protein